MLNGIFQTKTPEELLRTAEASSSALKRELGPLQITLLGIGAIIGTGIFTSIATAAAGDSHRPGAGASLMLSFVITAIACAFTALCYAEFASRVPISGSAYTYSYATLGELIAWIIGWDLIIEYAIGNVAVAIGWAGYFNAFLETLGIHLPAWLTTDYRSAASKAPEIVAAAPHILGIPIVFNILAAFIVLALTVVLVWGIKESARFNAGMVIFKVLILVFFVAASLWLMSPSEMAANWKPFQPNGWAGTFAGAAVVFFAFIGFDAVSTVAEETKNPKRDLPIGIFASLAICTLLYVIVAAVFTGLVPYQDLLNLTPAQRSEPLTMAIEQVAPQANWPRMIVALGSVIANTAVLLVFQLGQPRIFFSMARDGMLPQRFAAVHPRYKTPHVTTILTGVLVAAFAGVASIDEMIDLTNIGTLFAFVLVSIGIIVLRLRDKKQGIAPPTDGFRVPFGPFLLPILGVGSCVFLMVYLPQPSWWRFIGWLMLGLAIYSGYSWSRSVAGRRQHRPTRTPLTLKLSALGFFVAGIAMIFVLPHNVGPAKLLASLLAWTELPRASLGAWLTVLGSALGVWGWVSTPAAVQPATNSTI